MTRDEVVDLIGTLAKSGTAELRQQLREAKDSGGLRGADRPVRHRFLLDLHGGRRGRAAHPQGRRKRGHPVGVQRRGHLHHRGRRRRAAGHGGHAAPQARGRRGRAARLHRRRGRSGSWSRSTPTSSPGPSGCRSSDRPRRPRKAANDRHRRNRDAQLDEGAVGQAARRGLRRGVQGVLQAHRARLGRPARDHPR